MEDKISIILPIFNVGPHLRGGIDSLINQTIGNENLENHFCVLFFPVKFILIPKPMTKLND